MPADPCIRTATRGTSVAFIGCGFVLASWASRIPQVRDSLHLSAGELGLVLLAVAAGSVVGLPGSGPVIHRWGTRATTTVMAWVVALALAGVAVGHGLGALPLILDELIAGRGERESWFRFRLLPQFIAFVVFQQFWLMRVLRPAWAFRFNADIEDHAEHEYAEFAAEHPEWEDVPFRSQAVPEYGSYDSLADLIRQIGHDEGVHKGVSLDRMAQARSR